MALDFPASPSNGQVHTSGGTSWSYDGNKWVVVAGQSIEPVYIASTTPAGIDGQIYWDSDESTAYIYYTDGDGTSQWVPLTATGPSLFDASAITTGILPVVRGGTGISTFDPGKIIEGNTEAEVVDTGSDGHFKVTTEGTERLRVDTNGIDLTGNYRSNVTAVTTTDANGKHIIDCSAGNYFTKTISADEEFVFNNVPSTGVYSFTIEIEVNGDRTITWPGTVKFNGDATPTPTLAADKTHLFMFITDDGGTRFRGAALVDYDD